MQTSLLTLLVAAMALTGPATNAPEQRSKPYVLIVGIDGLRHDFAERFGAANLLAFRDRGSSSSALVPSFPSTTFPNFYTMATGLRPENHGVVGMRFFDPKAGREFFFAKNAAEGFWFGGTPIWVSAEQEGIRTAAFFWAGTEAEIRGVRPSIYHQYDSKIPKEQRVREVLEWFHRPEADRPHLVTLYFGDVDTAGHVEGPDSDAVRKAVLDVDKNFGQLMEGLKDVRPGVNVIVVSDHGMRPCSTSLDISGDADLSGFRVENDLTQILLYSSDKALVDRTYEVLKKNTKYRVYKRADTPKHLHYSQNERIGDLVVLPAATDAVGATTKDDESRWQRPMKGCHGYDPTDVAMHGTFYAAGPQIRNGVRLGPVENVEIYPLLVKLLGIKPPQKVDGTGVTARQLTY